MKKISQKMISLLLGICLLFSASVIAFAGEPTSGTTFTVSVVHTNDIHGRLVGDDYNEVLGLERVKTFKRQKENKSDMVFLVDAGDFFHGQSFATIDQGAAAADLMGDCGYDAMAVGNHDWNYGQDRLLELEKEVQEKSFMFSMLTGNVYTADNRSFFNNTYLTCSSEKVGGKLRVAIFALIDPRLYDATAPANVEGLVFEDMQAYAQEQADHLKDLGCDIVICLAHCIDPVSLAVSVDNVDLWVAGHDHKEIAETVQTPNGGSALVVENSSYLNTFGNVDIQCTLDENGEVVDMQMQATTISYEEGSSIPGNADMLNLIETIKTEQAPLLERVVGYTPETLNGTWEDVRIKETNLARAVTNGYLLATGADIAMENGGGIRAGIDAGDVTYGDILDVSPFGNYVVTVSLSGTEILSMLERSLEIMHQNQIANDSGEYDAWPDNSGNMLQVAGMQVVYDMSAPAGNRVVSASVGGSPIVQEQQYTVAMNSFLVTDTADYPELAGKSTVHEYGACEDILTAYFSQSGDTILKDLHTENLVAKTNTSTTPGDQQGTEPGDTTGEQTTSPSAGETETTRNPEKGEQAAIPDTGTQTIAVLPFAAVCSLTGCTLIAANKRRKKAVK